MIRVLASRIDGMALRLGRRQGNALWQGRRARLGGVLRCQDARACDHMPLQPTAIGVVCHAATTGRGLQVTPRFRDAPRATKVRVSPRYRPCYSVSE